MITCECMVVCLFVLLCDGLVASPPCTLPFTHRLLKRGTRLTATLMENKGWIDRHLTMLFSSPMLV